MVFSSAVFITMFLPVVFILNILIKKEYSNTLLFLASLFFYAWGEPILVLLLVSFIVINWLFGKVIGYFVGNKRKIVLIIGILCDVGILGYYKYVGFIVQVINTISYHDAISLANITMPIGISFFTFRAISYIIDVYNQKVNASSKFVNVALYISFFPLLIAGPIVKYRDINKQIDNRNITFTGVATGVKRFIYGLGKKALISNILGVCVNTIYSLDFWKIDWKAAWIGALAYTFQIYYDFSGYSDMAIGLGKMFGFDIPENFIYPYLSSSISEFWRRWHVSLGGWFREYVYIPLGGNRKGKVRTYVNLFIVFFLTGLWHGAAYTFVTWGMYYGFFMILERMGLYKVLAKSKFFARVYCFIIVNFGWVIFRADNLYQALRWVSRMIMPWKYSTDIIPMYYLDNKIIFVGMCSIMGIGFLKLYVPQRLTEKWKDSIPEAIYCVLILVLSMAAIVSDTYNPFIYFQF